MKQINISKIVILIATITILLIVPGCGKQKPQQYGEKVTNRNLTAIESILQSSSDFEGKDVTVQGKIIRECPTGCWFEIKDKGAIMYVDINPSGFAIPQEIGETVIVEGKIKVRDNKPILVGKGVEIQ